MGLLDKFFGQRDPTQEWQVDPRLTLSFDFATHSLCGVKLGESLERLRGLGPCADSASARSGVYRYYSRGFSVDDEDGRLGTVVLFWNDVAEGKFAPFVGECLLHGESIQLSSRTTEDEIKELFGQPYWQDFDGEETLLFYEYPGVEHQVELGKDGCLRAIVVLSPPMLADPEQRRSYDVTEPWPPP